MDFAERAHNHNYRIDPIVRSLLDTDFYKFLMMQFIWNRYPNEIVRFRLTNRSKKVRLADLIDITELRAQLDEARKLRFGSSELVWLRGQTFYGQTGIFSQGFIDTLKHFQLPDYDLSIGEDGQFNLTVEGPWWQVTLWEIVFLRIVNVLRNRTLMRQLSKTDLDIMFAQAKVKLYRKLKVLQGLPDLKFSDFSTRRAFDFLWQEYAVKLAKEMLGDRMIGTSNVLLAYQNDLQPIGTNAHELPMVFAALAQQKNPDDMDALVASQYEVLHQWANDYHGNLLVALPDTFGTTQFLAKAPWETSLWKGFRPDSKNPMEAGNELIEYWHNAGITDAKIAADKLIVFADGLDVAIDGFEQNGHDITAIYEYFHGRVGLSFGMGTNFGNDFIGCAPGEDPDLLKSISIVVKVDRVNMTHSAVKLSDNYDKATGDPATVEIYRKAFGSAGMANAPVNV